MEVPRLGGELELQLLAHVTARAMQNPSHICNLHHSSQQYQIINPLTEARDQTHIFMDTSQVHYHRATMGTPLPFICLIISMKIFMCNPLQYLFIYLFVCLFVCFDAQIVPDRARGNSPHSPAYLDPIPHSSSM